MIVITLAFEPDRPVAPKKRRNVAVAGIVGLMLEVFMAFYLEFWQKIEEVKKSQAHASKKQIHR